MLAYQQTVYAEVVYSDPNFATEIDSITVFFNAAMGDQGLMDFTDYIECYKVSQAIYKV